MRTRWAFSLQGVVIVVFAGLSVYVLCSRFPNFWPKEHVCTKQSQVKAAIGANGSRMQAIDMYKFNTGDWPETLNDLIERPSKGDFAKKWAGPYLKDNNGLIDPWGHEFQYRAPGIHNKNGVDLWSMGPDGRDGTDDDVVNWGDDK